MRRAGRERRSTFSNGSPDRTTSVRPFRSLELCCSPTRALISDPVALSANLDLDRYRHSRLAVLSPRPCPESRPRNPAPLRAAFHTRARVPAAAAVRVLPYADGAEEKPRPAPVRRGLQRVCFGRSFSRSLDGSHVRRDIEDRRSSTLLIMLSVWSTELHSSRLEIEIASCAKSRQNSPPREAGQAFRFESHPPKLNSTRWGTPEDRTYMPSQTLTVFMAVVASSLVL
jgi:hypothetical protein